MSLIRLDAAAWQGREDMWQALLAALGAPEWHGPNLDALYDGLVAGENRVRPPLMVEIAATRHLPVALVADLTRVRIVFEDAARDTGLPITLGFVQVAQCGSAAVSTFSTQCGKNAGWRDDHPDAVAAASLIDWSNARRSSG